MSISAAASFDRIEEVEAVVNEIFANSLSGASFLPEANFFEIGGSSLLLAIILTELERRLNLEIPVAVFLENPNARDFAARLHGMVKR